MTEKPHDPNECLDKHVRVKFTHTLKGMDRFASKEKLWNLWLTLRYILLLNEDDTYARHYVDKMIKTKASILGYLL